MKKMGFITPLPSQNAFVSKMMGGEKWESLSEDYRIAFKTYYIENESLVRKVCMRLVISNRFYTKEEGDFLRKLWRGDIVSDDDLAFSYSFISKLRLINPLQISYGHSFNLFPYSRIDFSAFRFNHFFSLEYKGKDISENLVGCIHIARLLQTFRKNAKIRDEYSIEIKSNVLRGNKKYSLDYNNETCVFTVNFGIKLEALGVYSLEELYWKIIRESFTG